MSAPTFTIIRSSGGSFELGDDTYTRVRRGVTGMAVPPVDIVSLPYLSSDGSALISDRRPAAEMLVPLLITTDPEAGGARYVESVVASYLNFGPVTLRVDTGGRIRERLEVVYTGGLEGNESVGSSLSDDWRKVVLELTALDPWWYGDTINISLDFDDGVAFDSPGTAFDSSTTNFDGLASVSTGIPGDATAFPIVTLQGPFTTCYIGKTLSSERIELAGPLAEGDTITVDSRPGSRGPRLNNGPVDWSLLTSESRLLRIEPSAGPFVRLYAAATGTDVSSVAEVSYRQRWLTP